jgi:two-component system sensor histidine kinase DesK
MSTSSSAESCAARNAREHDRGYFARRWWFFAGVWLIYLAEPIAGLWQHESVPLRVVGLALIAVFSAAYILLVPRGAFGGPRVFRVAALGIMGAAACLFLVLCGRGGGGLVFTPYLVVTLLVLLSWRLAVPAAVALIAIATLLPQYVHPWEVHGFQWGIGGGALFAAVVVAGMRLLAGTQYQLSRAEEEIEQMAAEQERLRIARDLHDLLGHALTTVSVKAELASRLVAIDPARAAAEMAEVAELSRQSLVDVRATVSGYREVSLVRELATAREILQAAGIEAELPGAAEDVAGDLRELFGWALREGITNAVLHSRARRVVVRLERRSIEVVNDGVSDGIEGPEAVSTPAASGHGLIGLSERAAALGGEVQAGRDGESGYRLRVEVPA